MTKDKGGAASSAPVSSAPASAASDSAAADAPGSAAELAARASAEVSTLERELEEIDMLVAQARSEASRHETRRAQVAEKLAGLGKVEPKEAAELASQLVTLTKRAAVMEAQVDVLEGKRHALTRYRDSLAGYGEWLAAIGEAGPVGVPSASRAQGTGAAGEAGVPPIISAEAEAAALPPAISRVVLGAQEDLRREIARAMHDGPAQSLTNIVLQAQIVDRLLARDPELARAELQLLIGMVQQTLDATKSFIFDVRPMVLDDLGLLPTLRRAARDRGRRAQLPVEFDSDGADRRLGVEIESGLFRIVDEALAAYLDRGPDRVAVRLDWGDALAIEIGAYRTAPAVAADDAAAPAPGADVPPALAAMIEDRREKARAAAPGPVALPATTWREIQGRAQSIGATAELLDEGSRVRLEVPLPVVS